MLLVASWEGGVHVVDEGRVELPARVVRSLVTDHRGGALAIVDGHEVCRRSPTGSWSSLATVEAPLSACVAVGNAVFAGTDDARILRITDTHEWLEGFGMCPGRAAWYAGTAVVDGRVVGPPLGIRSLTATADGKTLLANVHVGGIPRSTDGGRTWHPTIDVEADVHQVLAHPTRPELVIAASAIGLCTSHDGGTTWTVEARGLHAPHCSGVAFGRHDIFVSASVDPFSPDAAIYRRPMDADTALELVRPTAGKADTDCITTAGTTVAFADQSGQIVISTDDGGTWSLLDGRVPSPSSALLLPGR